jgi:flagellar motor switch protein FliM
MISVADNNLTREKIQQLLGAVGKRTSDVADQNPDAKEHNWRASKYFSNEQVKNVEAFAAKAAGNVAAGFQKLFFYNFNVAVTSVSQHTAGDFMQPGGSVKYYLSFAAKDQQMGVFVMPSQTANLWASQLMGESKSTPASEKELSQLELSLLCDAASSAIKAVSDAYADVELKAVGEVSPKFPLEVDNIQDICKVGLSIRKADAEQPVEAFFLFLSDKLTAIAGQSKAENIPPQNITKALMTHLHNIPVSMTIRFAGAKVNLQQLMALEPDDTILLDKKLSEPVEVIYDNKVVFRAKPARADDNYAVVITELYNNKK